MTGPLEVLFETLARASLAGACVALVVWILFRTFGRLAGTTRCVVWWLVSLKLLVGLLWIAPVVLPVLPAAVAPGGTISAPVVQRAAAGESSSLPRAVTTSWRGALTALWLLGLAFVAASTWRHVRRTVSIRSEARAASADVIALVRELSARVGLARPPDTRVSDQIDAPMVVGLMSPTILLPSQRWPLLTSAQREMAICHELVHVRRGDLWLGLVPALAERIFFFHPMAHVASREYVIAREVACDMAVLRALDAAPREYGRLLLTLGVAPFPGGLAASGAAHSFSSLKRRILMLDHDAPTVTSRLAGWVLAIAALVALVPLTLVERPAAAQTAATAPEPPKASRQTRTPGSGFEYMLVLGDKDGTIMSGNFDDQRVEPRRDRNERVLWFRRGGKTYEVRDPSAIEQAAAIVSPMSAIGRQQGEIGAKQGAIGAQQGLVGARQGEVGARQGAVGAQQGALGARQGELGARQAHELSAAEKQLVEAEQQQIDREMRVLTAKMAELDKEMREVAVSMPDLDGEMAKLSKQMDVLSRKMTEASAKADAEMQMLVDKLIKLGTAKPIN